MSVSPHPLDLELAAVLPQGSLYAVGGRVRDELRSTLDGVLRPAKDLDYVVTGLRLGELIVRLEKLGRADVVGASFAVVKLAVGDRTVDIALPRRERSTGVGHREFAVESGPDIPLVDDLGRRDFRMNMLARALPGGALIDPFGGAADIRARRVDLLHIEAFVDDPLRMLRACQFAARFGFSLSERTLGAMRSARQLVMTVSPERVRDELVKLVELSDTPSGGLEAMRAGGLLEFVLPEIAEGIGITQNVFHAYDVYRHSLVTLDATPAGDLTLRLAALLHDVGKPRTRTFEPDDELGAHFYRHEVVGADMAGSLLTRFRFANEVVDDVTALVAHHMYSADPRAEPKTLRRFVRRIGASRLGRQFALRAADIVGSGLPKRDDSNERFEQRVAEILAERPAMSVADLVIGGAEVVEALTDAGRLPPGSRGGPEVGIVLRRLLEAVLDDPAANTLEALSNLLPNEITKLDDVPER